jgi:hypothetical protein
LKQKVDIDSLAQEIGKSSGSIMSLAKRLGATNEDEINRREADLTARELQLADRKRALAEKKHLVATRKRKLESEFAEIG